MNINETHSRFTAPNSFYADSFPSGKFVLTGLLPHYDIFLFL